MTAFPCPALSLRSALWRREETQGCLPLICVLVEASRIALFHGVPLCCLRDKRDARIPHLLLSFSGDALDVSVSDPIDVQPFEIPFAQGGDAAGHHAAMGQQQGLLENTRIMDFTR